jgi:diguanylate cyclase (GGDEF)-like protein
VDTLVEIWNITFTALLAISGAVGVLAISSTRLFAFVASYGNQTLYHGGETHADKHSFDIDKYVLAHGRLFGVIVAGLSGYLWIISKHGPDVYSRSFLMTILSVSLVMGIVALRHIVWQKHEIESNLAEAHADPLTGLGNRRLFDLEMSRALTQRQRQGAPLCLLIMDIDYFKTFNNEFGHLLGDAVLKEVADITNEIVSYRGTAARIGGDEFVALLPDSTLDEASCIAEKLRVAIDTTPLRYDGKEHSLTVCIGVAEAQVDDDASSLLKRGDSALYAAKDAGRNCSYRHGSPEPAVLTPCK